MHRTTYTYVYIYPSENQGITVQDWWDDKPTILNNFQIDHSITYHATHDAKYPIIWFRNCASSFLRTLPILLPSLGPKENDFYSVVS